MTEQERIDRKKFHEAFKRDMPLDGLLVAVSGSLKIDVIKLDKMVQDLNPDYDSDNCTYKGVGGYSLSKLLGEVYGEEIVGIIKKYL